MAYLKKKQPEIKDHHPDPRKVDRNFKWHIKKKKRVRKKAKNTSTYRSYDDVRVLPFR